MKRLRVLIALVLALASTSSAAQTIRTYTQNAGGADTRPLGYPVPLPIATLTPVDGFRDYASLLARHEALDLASPDVAGFVVGQTLRQRPIRAYVLSDPDGTTVDGQIEGSFFINATTPARAWQTPEVATGIIEYLVANAGDRGLVRFRLDNTRLVIVPVQNIDGLLQTQRFPTQVIVGQDPSNPNDWPRDGRMRRKNLRDTDEILTTLGDHLLGVDLNRNHPPFWATSSSSSTDPRSLTFHGSGPHSEPEHDALRAALALVPASSIRLGQDLHSFSMVFLSESSGIEPRTNLIRDRIVDLMRNHNAALTRSDRFPQGRSYRHQPSPAGSGIGSADEYLATTYSIPAWTLELEPLQSGTEYGGTGDSHGGFILPASEIRRVRDGWARAHAAALYHVAGPPYLTRVIMRDAETDERRYLAEWVAGEGGRVKLVQRDAPLIGGRRYRVELAFSKPMRIEVSGSPAGFEGVTAPAEPVASLQAVVSLNLSGGAWQGDPGRWQRYRFDTYAGEITLPVAAPGTTALSAPLQVSTQDLAGMGLDVEPGSPVDWQRGAWRGWQSETGVEGDVGGVDRNHRVFVVASEVEPTQVMLLRDRIEEGESAALLIERLAPGPALEIGVRVVGLTGSLADVTLGANTVSWSQGESGPRVLSIAAVRDTFAEGPEAVAVQLEVRSGVTALRGAAPIVTIGGAPQLPQEETRATGVGY
jgi:hypothetical protein